jgi:hypothetical protein
MPKQKKIICTSMKMANLCPTHFTASSSKLCLLVNSMSGGEN